MTLTITQLRAALNALPLHALAATNVESVDIVGSDILLAYKSEWRDRELTHAKTVEADLRNQIARLELANADLRAKLKERRVIP